MKRLWLVLTVGAVGGFGGASGCVADSDPRSGETVGEIEQKELGGLSLSLVSNDSQGRAYRLRNATFNIQPEYWGYDGGAAPSATVLSSESDPDAARLSVRLVPGPYRVTLSGDWFVERLSPAGYERVEQVALLTEPTQYAYIGQDWYYDVEYRFGVDGTLIDFRHGDLNIGIAIELPSDGPSYDGGFPVPGDAGPSVDGGVPLPVDGGSYDASTPVDASLIGRRDAGRAIAD
jgi:hypothetical protein